MSYVIGETWNADDLDWQTGGEPGDEYALSNDAYTWSDARAYAQSRGGDLAGCLEGEECDWLFSVFHPGTEDFTQYWLGGLQDELGEEPDELWEWVFTGYPIYPEDPWLPGAPNDGDPGENCTTSGGGPSHPACRDYDVAALVYNADVGTSGSTNGLDDLDESMELRAIIQRDPDDICTDGITDYTRTYAWGFRYDGPRQRYLRRKVNPNDLDEVWDQEWSDYDKEWIYADFVLDSEAPGGAHTFRDYLTGEAHADSSTHGVWDGEAYYHTDQVGSTRLMTDGTPSTVREYVYDAFGNVYESSGSATTRYRYAGRWGYQSHDAFPFLHVGARYYDPETGRFLQRDPIGIAGGLNVYAYLNGRPANGADPFGLMSLAPDWGPWDYVRNGWNWAKRTTIKVTGWTVLQMYGWGCLGARGLHWVAGEPYPGDPHVLLGETYWNVGKAGSTNAKSWYKSAKYHTKKALGSLWRDVCDGFSDWATMIGNADPYAL